MTQETIYQAAKRLGLRPYVTKSTKKSWDTFLKVFEMYPGDYLVEIIDQNKRLVFLKPKSYNRMIETTNLLNKFSAELQEAETFFEEMASKYGESV